MILEVRRFPNDMFLYPGSEVSYCIPGKQTNAVFVIDRVNADLMTSFK
jgi:hypothetical protein